MSDSVKVLEICLSSKEAESVVVDVQACGFEKEKRPSLELKVEFLFESRDLRRSLNLSPPL